MKVAKAILIPCAAMVAYLCACSIGAVAGGSSSDVPNGITIASANGVVDGQTVPGAMVAAFSTDYIPGSVELFDSSRGTTVRHADSVVADTLGGFSFAGLPASRYNFLAYDQATQRALLVGPVPVFADTLFDTTVDSMYVAGGLSGTARNQTGEVLSNGVVLIRGTPYFSPTDSAGGFAIAGVAAGSYRLELFQEPDQSQIPYAVPAGVDTVVISAGGETHL
jgi:hypothetical protein